MAMNQEKLTNLIEYTLTKPPTATGVRLKSYRDLAEIFQVSESQIRTSIGRLVKKGILVRHQGSGTFVRRIPDLRTISQSISGNGQADILARTPPEQCAEIKKQIKLKLALCADLLSSLPVYRKVLASISQCVQERGHRSEIISLHDHSQNPAICLERIRDNTIDGFIVCLESSGPLAQGLIQNKIPAVFFAVGFLPIQREPLVLFDTAEATERALSILAEHNYDKIAMISYLYEGHARQEGKIYERIMGDLGKNYRTILWNENEPPDIIKERIIELIRSPKSPDAIYVSDDNLLSPVAEALKSCNLKPGKDIGVITLSNRSIPLNALYHWSTLEFDVERFGQLVVDELLWTLEHASARPSTISLHAAWLPGETLRSV